MLGIPGVSPAPQPMDLSASLAGHSAPGSAYLVAAVALPLLLTTLIGLRLLSAPARWGGWDPLEPGGWARRLPYELFVMAAPVLASIAAEWIAVAAVVSGDRTSAGDHRLILAAAALVVAMGVWAARWLRDRRFSNPRDAQIPIN